MHHTVQHCNDSIFVTVANSEVHLQWTFSVLLDNGDNSILDVDNHVHEMMALRAKRVKTLVIYHRHIQIAIINAILPLWHKASAVQIGICQRTMGVELFQTCQNTETSDKFFLKSRSIH
jgi:hypothetical protein